MTDTATIVLCAILLGALVPLAAQARRHGVDRSLAALLALISAGALAIYTQYGALHTVAVQTGERVVDRAPGGERSAWFHWHEHFHYYLGARYYDELGYFGLYEAVALVDHERRTRLIRVPQLRDLSAPLQPITRKEGLRRAREIYRPRFTEERWQAFGDDVEALSRLAYPRWFDVGMFDAGFNPPPTWVLLGQPLAAAIDLGHPSPHDAEGLAGFEWLPLFDVALIAIAAAAIGWGFGPVGVAAFIVLFGTGYLTSARWTGGAFLRHPWFCALSIGLACLRRERFTAAGIALGASTALRVFPIVFIGGAGLALLWRAWRDWRRWGAMLRFSVGALGAIAALIGLSAAVFGVEAWAEFAGNIGAHSEMWFVHHLGYRRVATFAEWVPAQDFWWGPGLERMAEWNARLSADWAMARWTHAPVILGLCAAAALAARHIEPAESALLAGGVVVFVFALPANYYFVFLALAGPVLLTGGGARRAGWLAAGLCALWLSWRVIPRLDPDHLVQNVYNCVGLLALFITWAVARAWPSAADGPPAASS